MKYTEPIRPASLPHVHINNRNMVELVNKVVLLKIINHVTFKADYTEI